MAVIAVDFDGTIVEHRYPEIGPEVPGAFSTLQALVDAGHEIILWTIRDGEHRKAAADYVRGNGIPLLGVNHNPQQKEWSTSPKVYAHTYIDDAALGCPLVEPGDGRRPYVDWYQVRTVLVLEGLIR